MFSSLSLLSLSKEIGECCEARKSTKHRKGYNLEGPRLPAVHNIYPRLGFLPLVALSRSVPFVKVESKGGNIEAIKCQIAFQVCSSFQPHQEGCLKRQSTFVLTKCIYSYFLFF